MWITDLSLALPVLCQVAIEHGTGHPILKAAMYNRLDEMREMVMSDPRAIQEKEVPLLSNAVT